jgi:hypothetical protein
MRSVAGVLVVTILLVSIGSLRAQGDEESEIDFAAVRGNPVLRQALSANSPFRGGPGDSVETKFRENWIDMQVDYFVRKVYQRLSSLRASVEEAKGRQILARDQVPRKSPETVAEWRAALKRAEEQSKGLRMLLGGLLIELRTRDKFQIKTTNESAATSFSAEMALLSEQLTNAEESVRDYFFKPTHTTSVNELKGANMLDYLKRVEIIAREIRQRL